LHRVRFVGHGPGPKITVAHFVLCFVRKMPRPKGVPFRRSIAVAIVLMLPTSCWLISALDPAREQVAPRDASSDAAQLADAARDSENPETAPMFLVPNGDFELVGEGCGPNWRANPNFTALTRDAAQVAHACEVCPVKFTNSYVVSNQPIEMALAADASGSYFLRFKLRDSPTKEQAENVYVTVSYANDPSDAGVLLEAQPYPPASDWRTYTTSTFPAASGRILSLKFEAKGLKDTGLPLPQKCFAIDDVEFVRAP
jgi:hypothetical protein